jgi:hypothetical protein
MVPVTVVEGGYRLLPESLTALIRMANSANVTGALSLAELTKAISLPSIGLNKQRPTVGAFTLLNTPSTHDIGQMPIGDLDQRTEAKDCPILPTILCKLGMDPIDIGVDERSEHQARQRCIILLFIPDYQGRRTHLCRKHDGWPGRE